MASSLKDVKAQLFLLECYGRKCSENKEKYSGRFSSDADLEKQKKSNPFGELFEKVARTENYWEWRLVVTRESWAKLNKKYKAMVEQSRLKKEG